MNLTAKENEMGKSIYDLNLFENTWINNAQLDFLRVPGGWIVREYDTVNDCFKGYPIFIPFNNEFQNELNCKG